MANHAIEIYPRVRPLTYESELSAHSMEQCHVTHVPCTDSSLADQYPMVEGPCSVLLRYLYDYRAGVVYLGGGGCHEEF